MKHATIRGITWRNPRGFDPLVASSEAWRKRGRVPVVWEQLPWYEFEEAVLSSLRSEEGRYDLIMFDHPWTGSLAGEDLLIPWNEALSPSFVAALDRDMIRPSTESYTLDGHTYAIPLDAACHIGLYRKDLVRETDIPGTWEELEAWARSFASPSAPSPLVLSVEGVLGSCLFLTVMASIGSPAFHERDGARFDKDIAEYVLSVIHPLLNYVPDGSVKWGPWDIYREMATHTVAAYSPSIFGYVNYNGILPYGPELRFGVPPGFRDAGPATPIIGGVGLGLARHAASRPYYEDILGYAAFLADPETHATVFLPNKGQPSAKTIWSDDATDSQYNGFYTASGRAMKRGYIRPRYAGFHEVELSIGRILQELWDGNASVSQTVKKLGEIPAR